MLCSEGNRESKHLADLPPSYEQYHRYIASLDEEDVKRSLQFCQDVSKLFPEVLIDRNLPLLIETSPLSEVLFSLDEDIEHLVEDTSLSLHRAMKITSYTC